MYVQTHYDTKGSGLCTFRTSLADFTTCLRGYYTSVHKDHWLNNISLYRHIITYLTTPAEVTRGLDCIRFAETLHPHTVCPHARITTGSRPRIGIAGSAALVVLFFSFIILVFGKF